MTELNERVTTLSPDDLHEIRQQLFEISRKLNLPLKVVMYPPSRGMSPVVLHQLDCYVDCAHPELCDDYFNTISGEALWKEIHGTTPVEPSDE